MAACLAAVRALRGLEALEVLLARGVVPVIRVVPQNDRWGKPLQAWEDEQWQVQGGDLQALLPVPVMLRKVTVERPFYEDAIRVLGEWVDQVCCRQLYGL
jgi:hypothetical protein